MKDSYGREINYMRISVTDRCNLRCKYCMPEDGVADIGHEQILSFEEIVKIVKASVALGITKFRLTGGEPLVRKGIEDLVRSMAAIEGVEEITMTTNGVLLGDMAHKLKEAGLSRVNVSMDSMRYSRLKEMSRGGEIDDVVAGINAATGAGLKPVKLNVVVIRGFNDDEILDFLQLTFQHDYEIRFIELMPMGENSDNKFEFVPTEEIMAKMPALREIPGVEGHAKLYKYPGARGKIGFISPVTECFCEGCNKIRLTADGHIKPCLHSDTEIDLKPVLGQDDEEALKEAIRQAILGKEEGHQLEHGKSETSRNMNKIGG